MNKLLLYEHYLLYVGSSFETVVHSHHASQVCIGLENTFQLSDAKMQVESFRAVVIAANANHKLEASKTAIASLFLDVQSDVYKALSTQYQLNKDKPFLTLDLSKELLTKLNQLHSGSYPWLEAKNICQQIISEITGEHKLATGLDPRVIAVLEKLNSHTESQVPLDELAGMVHLSPSRLAHLFKSEVGTPIRRYSLWSRIRVAMKYALQHQSITEGAHYAGFTDSAHFSKVFKQMYGINPSAILNKQFPIEVIFE
jgi:AraC-like DNA-binding protein